jgi:hypothetical protein
MKSANPGRPGGHARRRRVAAAAAALLLTTACAAVGAGPSAAADSCPNADVRAQQRSTYLPECRAYEAVSPVDTNGTDVQNALRVSADGRAIAWISLGAYANTPGINASAQYVGRRTPTEWVTTPLNPIYGADTNIDTSTLLGGQALNDDLTRMFFNTSAGFDPADTDLTPGVAGEILGVGGEDIYATDADGAAMWVSKPDPGFDNSGESVEQYGHSGDGGTALWSSPNRLTSDGPVASSDGVDLYRWRNGQVDFVGVDAQGVPLPRSALGAARAVYTNNGSGDLGVMKDSEAVSRDGSRFVYTGYHFNGPPNAEPMAYGRLFLHRDGRPSEELTLSRRQESVGERGAGIFLAAADDVNQVLLWGDQPLTDDAPAESDPELGGIYRYDVTADSLTFVSSSEYPHHVPNVRAVADQGVRFYFTSTLAVAPGAVAGPRNLYFASPDGVRFIAAVDPLNAVTNSDGKTLAFDADGPVTGDPTGGSQQAYRYDANTDQLSCLSCRADSKGAFIAPPRDVGVPVPQAVTDDGTVYVTTADAHALRDTNGDRDVYAVAPTGEFFLVSSGTAKYETYFVGASRDGEDVYIDTRGALSPQDNDGGLRDIYDVRRRGGFLAEEGEPDSGCTGDACQPPVSDPGREQPSTDRAGPAGNAPTPVRGSVSSPRLSKAQLRALARGRSVSVKVKVNRSGRAAVKLTARVRGRTAPVGSATARAAQAGTVALSVRLSATARQTLARAGRLTLTVTVSFSSASKVVRYSTVLAAGRS